MTDGSGPGTGSSGSALEGQIDHILAALTPDLHQALHGIGLLRHLPGEALTIEQRAAICARPVVDQANRRIAQLTDGVRARLNGFGVGKRIGFGLDVAV